MLLALIFIGHHLKVILFTIRMTHVHIHTYIHNKSYKGYITHIFFCLSPCEEERKVVNTRDARD